MSEQVNSGIRSDNVQEMLESAKNAGDKGQASFYTTLGLAHTVAKCLPAFRPQLCDLTSGDGHFLIGAANETTKHLFGSDLDGIRTMSNEKEWHVNKITGDLTLLHNLLDEVKWRADLFVLNPPWDLHWHRDRFKRLAQSDLLSVRQAFTKGHDRRLGDESIDSTVATLMLALDFCTQRGEGVLISNNATLERLIFGLDAPFAALKQHCWLRAAVKGNPMTPHEGSKWGDDFQTGFVWFAKSHIGGPQNLGLFDDQGDLDAMLSIPQRRHRTGVSVGAAPHIHEDTRSLWGAVKDEWKTTQDAKKPGGFNIWLDPDGCIKTQLSLFQDKSFKVDKAAAKRLFALNGQRPMQLVMQRAQRAELLRTVNGGVWRVHPDLPAKVDAAVREYLSVRAPLYPLSEVQRLGYLDEQDMITCKKDLVVEFKPYAMPGFGGRTKESIHQSPPRVVFHEGESYPIRTQAVRLEKSKTKPNSAGYENEFLISGQDLAIFIKDATGKERCFMDARLMKSDVKLDGVKVDHELQLIPEHFDIPEVPDMADLNPDGMRNAVAEINRIEQFMAEMGLG